MSNKGKITALLFVNVMKAFDFLNHKVLLGKLEYLGLSARSLRWFISYFADRQQSVMIIHQSIEIHASQPPEHSGDFMRAQLGLNALLTAPWPLGAVDLTKYL